MQQPVTELDTRFSDQDAARPAGKRLASRSGEPSSSGSRPSGQTDDRMSRRPYHDHRIEEVPSTNPFPRVRAREHGERS